MHIVKSHRLGLAFILLLNAHNAMAARDDDLDDLRRSEVASDKWQIIKQDNLHNITAYARREQGKSLRSFKVEVEVDANLDTISRVTFDLPNYKRWFYQVKEARLLKKVSDREFYYYIVHAAPATLPDRDAILHAVIQPYSPKTGTAIMKVESVPDYLPPKPPLVRMVAENMVITWTSLGKNRWKNVSEGYFDPGGFSPDWAVNFVQRAAPYQTVLGLRRILLSDDYVNSKETPAFSYGGYD